MSRLCAAGTDHWSLRCRASDAAYDLATDQWFVLGALDVWSEVDDLMAMFAGIPLPHLVHPNDPAMVPAVNHVSVVARFGGSES